MTIEAPFHEVKSITGTIEFADGSKVEFGLGYDHDWANGSQPWIGKSTDIRTAINTAMHDEEFWHRGDEEPEPEEDEERECSRCEDTVLVLNSRDECAACEAARERGDICSRCDEDIDWNPALGAYKVSTSEAVVAVCGGCAHNERRSS